MTNPEMLNLLATITAAVVSAISLLVAIQSNVRSKKAEDIKNLLGEKENVAFGALKLLRDGLPKKKKDRQLLISALLQACLFEGSDRARALIYRVIEQNKQLHLAELKEGLHLMKMNLTSMDKYQFTKDELDLSRGSRRIAAIEKVINQN